MVLTLEKKHPSLWGKTLCKEGGVLGFWGGDAAASGGGECATERAQSRKRPHPDSNA